MKKLNNEIIVISQKESIEKYYSPTASGKAFLYSTILSLVLSFCYYSILQICKVDVNNLNFILVCVNLFMGSLAFIIVVFNNKFKSKIKISKILNCDTKTPYYVYIIVAIMAVGLVLLSSNFITLVDVLIKNIGFAELGVNLEISNWWTLSLAIVFICALPAIFEELIFRGIILNSVKKRGIILAIFISTICFTLMHGNIYQTVFQFMLGLSLAFVVTLTCDVKTGMLMHFLNNLIIVLNSFIMLKLNKPMVVPKITAWYIVSAILMLLAAILLIVGGVFLIKFIMKKKGLGMYSPENIKMLQEEKAQSTNVVKQSTTPVATLAENSVEIKTEPESKQEKQAKQKFNIMSFFEEYGYLNFTILLTFGLWAFNTISLLG